MKKLITLVMIAGMILSSQQTQAQAFDQSTKMISLGIGGAEMFHIPVGYSSWNPNFYTPITGQISVEGEFAVHKYVGVGFNAGFGGRAGSVYTGTFYGVGYSGYGGYYPEFNIPVGGLANFHFYQFIADKTGKNIHADKLDIYAGINIGTGIAIHPGGYYDTYGVNHSGVTTDVLFWAGPQVGAHYFFKPNFGVKLEAGFGKSVITAGITWKLGGK
jgi:hypothetical protein